jgi:hypothetical protein
MKIRCLHGVQAFLPSEFLVDAADAAAADIFVTPPPPAKISRRAAAASKGAAPRSNIDDSLLIG